MKTTQRYALHEPCKVGRKRLIFGCRCNMAKIARNAQFTARSRVCVARRAGLSLILAPLATAPAVEGLAGERATGIGPGAAARHVEGATARIERLAPPPVVRQ
jgi:hypothetical protein